jgi:hypothetical protein
MTVKASAKSRSMLVIEARVAPRLRVKASAVGLLPEGCDDLLC